MARIAKFLENELDRISNYLSMAEANINVLTDLCYDKGEKISKPDREDTEIMSYLESKLSLIEAKIVSSKEVIADFKDYYFSTISDSK